MGSPLPLIHFWAQGVHLTGLTAVKAAVASSSVGLSSRPNGGICAILKATGQPFGRPVAKDLHVISAVSDQHALKLRQVKRKGKLLYSLNQWDKYCPRFLPTVGMTRVQTLQVTNPPTADSVALLFASCPSLALQETPGGVPCTRRGTPTETRQRSKPHRRIRKEWEFMF